MSDEQDQDIFLYDDFFSDPSDKGVEVSVEHRGKRLNFIMRKSVTLEERQRATDAAVHIELDKNGVPKLRNIDQSAFTRKILLTCLRSWPFNYPGGGAVPINEKTIKSLDSALADKLAAVVIGQDTAQEKASVPFGQQSEEG